MQDYILDLIAKEFSMNLTVEESAVLKEWRDLNDENEKEYQKHLNLLQDYFLVDQYTAIEVKSAWNSVENRIASRSSNGRIVFLRKYWIAAASIFACCLLVASVTYFHRLSVNYNNSMVLEKKGNLQQKAFIQFSNGTQQDLTVVNGNIQTANGVIIGKNNKGLLQMDEGGASKSNELEWVDVVVPNKSNYSLTLSDGSMVTLNSGSRLHYPTKFNSTIRQVKLAGEAYFDVRRDTSAPFIVVSNGTQTRVLGTAFNVSSYDNDTWKEITLERGKVEVTFQNKSYFLLPGKQFQALPSHVTVRDVQTSEFTGWRFGIVRFQDLKLSEITKKIERWYDVKFDFIDKSTEGLRFTGVVEQSIKLGELLKMIESTTNVKFVVNYNNIEVLRKKTQ